MKTKIKQLTIIFLITISIIFIKSAIRVNASLTTADIQQQQTNLQQQLQEIEGKIAQYQKDIKGIQGEKNTLQNKIKQLKKQSAAISLQIDATNINISSLKLQISSAQFSIDQNTTHITQLKKQMGQLLYSISKLDNYPTIYLFFGAQDFSSFFAEIENYAKITHGLNNILQQIKTLNEQIAQGKQDLANKQESAQNLMTIQSLQQQNLVDSVTQQNTILVQTRGKESNYQAMLSDTKKQAQAIRSRLYQLFNTAKQINFGQAVQIAQWASGNTGVRASFLLAILTQESSLGKNIGTCNRPNDPPNKSWKVVMKPDRDQAPFLKITDELGLNPDITPISCPMRGSNGQQIGWGGAMGPAQFIPSTWMGYKNKISAITGKAANPWDIRDAFLASAIKLAADGATSPSGEWAAAMRYFSGSTNSRYSFYGDSVIAQTEKYQNDIEALNK